MLRRSGTPFHAKRLIIINKKHKEIIMATDEAKKMNALKMVSLSLEVLAAEVWDTLGEIGRAHV